MTAKQTRKCKTLYETSIVNGALYFEDVRQAEIPYDQWCHEDEELLWEMLEDKNVTSIRLVSLSEEWEQRVYLGSAMITESVNMQLTLRKEKRGNGSHWYGYRRVAGKLQKRYFGTSDKFTQRALVDFARKMPSL